MTVNELYVLCAREGIETHSVKCPKAEAISMEIEGTKYIGIDRGVFKSEYRERLVLAHEMAHALTDAYYSDLDNPVNVKRMEWRANKKAVEMLIPREELIEFLDENTTVWDVSERFDVPVEMVKKAMWIYFKKEIA